MYLIPWRHTFNTSCKNSKNNSTVLKRTYFSELTYLLFIKGNYLLAGVLFEEKSKVKNEAVAGMTVTVMLFSYRQKFLPSVKI